METDLSKEAVMTQDEIEHTLKRHERSLNTLSDAVIGLIRSQNELVKAFMKEIAKHHNDADEKFQALMKSQNDAGEKMQALMDMFGDKLAGR
jgi:hypothetical protein